VVHIGNITSIIAVLLPFVTYLLTLPRRTFHLSERYTKSINADNMVHHKSLKVYMVV
jgi:hypothetical protein